MLSMIGTRRWPQWVWGAMTIVTPLAVFVVRVVIHR